MGRKVTNLVSFICHCPGTGTDNFQETDPISALAFSKLACQFLGKSQLTSLSLFLSVPVLSWYLHSVCYGLAIEGCRQVTVLSDVTPLNKNIPYLSLHSWWQDESCYLVMIFFPNLTCLHQTIISFIMHFKVVCMKQAMLRQCLMYIHIQIFVIWNILRFPVVMFPSHFWPAWEFFNQYSDQLTSNRIYGKMR